MSAAINAELLDLCQGMADLIDRCGLQVNADFDTALRAALAKAEAAEPDVVKVMKEAAKDLIDYSSNPAIALIIDNLRAAIAKAEATDSAIEEMQFQPTENRFDRRELATILAALRYWQEDQINPLVPGRGGRSAQLMQIATFGEQFENLSANEVDALFQRLNR